jgi:hypothetical protein
MDKNDFDRCGNCTRAFGFLARKVVSLEVEKLMELETLRELRLCLLFRLLHRKVQVDQVLRIRRSRCQSL